jgi:CelD/BcsL family acetyltransferase involved in cellulose biosynthesis
LSFLGVVADRYRRSPFLNSLPKLTQLRRPSSISPEKVEFVNPLDLPEWDSMLQSLPGSTLFHGSLWAAVLRETYGYQPVYCIVRLGDRLQGLLACMEVSNWFTSSRGVAIPFTDQSEPLVIESADPDKLLAATLAYGRVRGWKSLVLHGGASQSLSQAPSLPFYTHELDLSPHRDRLFQGLKESVRRNVRQAERNGITVEFGSSRRLIDDYYALHCLTRKKHGIPPQPERFFHRIQTNLLRTGHGFVALARVGERPVAGAVFLHQDRRAYYKFGASDEENLRLRGNNLVMWESICWLKKEGFASLDFGRTSIANEGLRKYKLGWGTREKTIYYYRFDFRKNAFVADQDKAHGFHNRIFRLMPLPMLRLSGRIQYRYMA